MKNTLNIIITLLVIMILGVIAYMFLFNKKDINEIRLNKNELNLYIGEKEILISTIIPSDANDKKIVWKSENEQIATVTEDGVVIALKEGETRVIVSNIDGKIGSICKIKVLPIEVEKIELSHSKINLTIGDKKTITGTVYPTNATYQELSYESSDDSIVTIDNNGDMLAKKDGTVTITVKSNNGISEICTVNVIPNASGITLNKTSVNLVINNSEKLIATITPSNASNKSVTWTSSDPNVVTVDNNGLIKGIALGEAIITAKSNNGKLADCKVLVKPQIIDVTGISLNKTNLTIEKSSQVTLIATITPNNATNKTITWSSSDNNIATVSNGKISPKKNGTVTITAKSSNGMVATSTVTVVNNTYQKTAIFFGDSITMGKYGNYSWANYIGEKYDLKSSINAGISGGVVSTFRGSYWIVDEVKKYKAKKVDYVIMHGGLNDIAVSVRLGEQMGSYKANDFSGNYDSKTFIGGLETYIYTVKKQWPNAKLGYIINYKTPNDSTIVQRDNEFYSKIMEVLRKWNISYINLFSGKTSSGVPYSTLLEVNTNKYVQDGIHLNRAGYNVISPYIYEWMNTL